MKIKFRVEYDTHYGDISRRWSIYAKKEGRWLFHRDKAPAHTIGKHYRCWWEYGMFGYAEDDYFGFPDDDIA